MGFIRGNTIYANFAVHSNLNFSGTPKAVIGGEKIRNTNIKGGDSFVSMDENRQMFLFNRTIQRYGQYWCYYSLNNIQRRRNNC